MIKYGLAGLAGLAMAGLIGSGPAVAQVCGENYTVRSSDTLSLVARTAYGVPRKWRVIYNANYKVIGTNPALIFPGQKLAIPCRNGKAPTAIRNVKKTDDPNAGSKKDQMALATERAVAAIGLNLPKKPAVTLPKIRLLTAGDYKPFTDQKLPKGGMITELVTTALESQRRKVNGPQAKVAWVNDWAAHLDPLLSNKAFDLGFPWFKPDCDRYDDLDKPARFRCDTFLFSKPVFEILVVFFKKKGSSFKFNSDADVVGSRLCRPSGYFTFDLDKDGRNWIKDKKVTLAQPQSIASCFEMLKAGEVDAVALNEFSGKAVVKKMKLSGIVETMDRPVSILNLHVIVAKTHKRAASLLKYVNEGLSRIRSNGIYGEIVDRHLTRFWSGQESS